MNKETQKEVQCIKEQLIEYARRLNEISKEERGKFNNMSEEMQEMEKSQRLYENADNIDEAVSLITSAEDFIDGLYDDFESEEVMDNIKIEIVNSAAGFCLCINDTRVAGSKPLCGGTIVQEFNVSVDDIIDAIGKDKLMKVEVSE